MARHPRRDEWSWGYTHPSGACPHEPACTVDRVRCLPQPKQSLAHVSLADVLFYGGALGGGKTEFSLVEAVTLCLQHPFGKVALFRRTLKQHREIISRFRQLVPRDIARYNSQDHIATFYNGAQLWFGYCEREADVYNYQGEEWIALFIDEASHFTEFQVTYLITRVRSANPNIRLRIVLTSNPGNVGHGWLKRWFIKPLPTELGDRRPPVPGEVWRPLPKPNDPTPPEHMLTRAFIPAYFRDNPALASAQPNYLAKAYALGVEKGRQLAEGDWDANDSMIVGGIWKEQHAVTSADLHLVTLGRKPGQVISWHVLPNPHWRPAVGSKLYGSVDYGYGAPWSFHIHAAMPGGHTRTFFEFYMARKRDVEQAQMIREALTRETFNDGKTPLMEGIEWIVMDPSMWNSREEQGLAKSIAEVYTDTMPRVQFQKGAAGRGARLSRPNRWLDALSVAPDGLPWWSVTTGCPDLIRTVPEIPWDPDDPEVEDEDSENHAYEDTGRFFEARPHAPRLPPDDPFKHLDAISAAHQAALAKKLDRKPGSGHAVPVPGMGRR